MAPLDTLLPRDDPEREQNDARDVHGQLIGESHARTSSNAIEGTAS